MTMHRPLVLALVGLLLAPAVGVAQPDTPGAAAIVERPDLQSHFTAHGTIGTMVVEQTGQPSRAVVVGSPRSRTRSLPSSTFKIPNSLIAIDAGVASGADQPHPGPNPNYRVAGSPFLPARSTFSSACVVASCPSRTTR